VNNSTAYALYEDDVRWLRFDIRLNNSYEKYINSLEGKGFKILGILDYQTLGVKIEKSGCTKNCNWTLQTWKDTVNEALNAYPNITAWEIWNEPEIGEFQSGILENGNPYAYFLIDKEAYDEIKARNPNSTVICLGGDNLFGAGKTSEQSYEWAEAVWSYGLGNYCDAISLHAYSVPFLLNDTIYNSTVGKQFNYWLGMYENLTHKNIWITETGMPSSANSTYQLNISNAQQEEFLNQSFSLFLSKSYVKAVFWFNLYGTADFPYNLDFGLLYPNMTKKPAFLAFERFAKEYD
ncbi:MAG: glycosyl hydrolase, partial [Candidatus Micrarchaeaceae archaeon]